MWSEMPGSDGERGNKTGKAGDPQGSYGSLPEPGLGSTPQVSLIPRGVL